MALWQGWLAAEVLERQLLATRPYEKTPGAADLAYQNGIQSIALALEQSPEWLPSSGSRLLSTLKEAMDRIRGIPVVTRNGRPKVGVLGEFYTALNTWANDGLFQRLEDLGMEVKTHGIAATNFLLLFAEHYHSREMRRQHKPLAAAFSSLRRHWMVKWADAVEAQLDDASGDVRLLRSEQIMEDIAGHIHNDIDPVSTTFVARFLDFIHKGVSGVNYVMVLNCMLSNMTLPIFRGIAAENQNLPILATPYDGLKTTNIGTRLEAFVAQAQEYHERFLGKSESRQSSFR
jgi:predicted nucleotide-binding protein (sugar kinase/HSP70/actin superfamily)